MNEEHGIKILDGIETCDSRNFSTSNEQIFFPFSKIEGQKEQLNNRLIDQGICISERNVEGGNLNS